MGAIAKSLLLEIFLVFASTLFLTFDLVGAAEGVVDRTAALTAVAFEFAIVTELAAVTEGAEDSVFLSAVFGFADLAEGDAKRAAAGAFTLTMLSSLSLESSSSSESEKNEHTKKLMMTIILELQSRNTKRKGFTKNKTWKIVSCIKYHLWWD